MKRPTSPHLSIYKWQTSSVLSILHRMTGAIVYFGSIVISWVIILMIIVPEIPHLDLIIKLCLYGVSAPFVYHFYNGIRHLIWDLGYGYNIKSIDMSAFFVLLISILTIIYLVLS